MKHIDKREWKLTKLPDLIIHDIPDEILKTLQNLANKKGVSIEALTRELIFTAVRLPSRTDGLTISIDRFQESLDLIFAAYGQDAIKVVDELGRTLVLLPASKYEALTS